MSRTTKKGETQAAGLQALLPALGVLTTVKDGLYDLVLGTGDCPGQC